ncbi:hypothetical protein VP01_1542g6 [Puccinia sorghi]|uniref:Uncharacterized protein n=1 Tax=Puccinia sorghi TaxID=27349 RepID=A0A0L6VIY1_9BASI|nr:hypothetical protein VP01_1542g6 [Puccinia sorghi]
MPRMFGFVPRVLDQTPWVGHETWHYLQEGRYQGYLNPDVSLQEHVSSATLPTTSNGQSQTSLTQPTPAPSGQTPNSNRHTHSGGWAPGFQSYNVTDCTTLVTAIKKILPLGSQEWGKVVCTSPMQCSTTTTIIVRVMMKIMV